MMEKRRPVPLISDYVAQSMAYAMAEGRLPRDVRALPAPATELLDALPEERAALGLLDLTMLERAARTASSCPDWLPAAVDRLAQRLGTLPIVNYHLLVEANPLDQDPRLFCTGVVGEAELFFYREHAVSEIALAQLLELATHVRRDMQCVDIGERTIVHIERVSTCLGGMIDAMRCLAGHESLRQHFNAMRPFWFSARSEIKDGPSGLSSSRVALMDIALTDLDDEYGAALFRRESTMDPHFRASIRAAWAERRLNLHALWSVLPESHQALLAPSLHGLARRLIEWRQAHIAAIAGLVPAVLTGAPGTGGEHAVRDLLKRRLRPAQELERATKKYLG